MGTYQSNAEFYADFETVENKKVICKKVCKIEVCLLLYY
jgi:hypothetical protein